MKINKKKLTMAVLTILLTSMSFLINTKAEKLVGSNTCYNFNHTTGAYIGSGTNDCVKKIENSHAYCTELGKEIRTNNYSLNSSWILTSKNAIMSGIIIEKTNSKYSDLKAYGMTTLVLNTYFGKVINNASSRNYYTNQEIKNIYDSAIEEYNTYKATNSLPKIEISPNQTFNYSKGMYISDKITISGLQKTYGGNSDKVTYKISADKGAKICTKASGIESSCSSSVSISDRTSYSFYVKVTNVNSSEVVRVNVTGSNVSTYPSSILYTGGNSSQQLVVKSSVTFKRSSSESIQLTVPNTTNHTIQARKVNEYGELITGSVLEIYEDTPYTGRKLASGTSESVITYTSPTVSIDDDNFFTHDYYLVEKLAPNGYILNSEVTKFFIKNSNEANSTLCYHNIENNSEDSELVDNERCNFADYENKCQGSDGSIKELTENNDCIFEKPEEIPATEEDTADTSENENTTEDNTTEEDNNEEETTPKITYEKVCYKISTGKIEKDNTYCDNKGEYIKVEKNSGNIVVTHPNEKNKLKISKKSITGDKEITGAKLKICTKAEYDIKKDDCEAANTIDNIKMEWISGTTPREYQGIATGDYYIVETIAPKGYIKTSTATSFSVDSTGKMSSDKKELEDNTIVIKNQLNSFIISKQDMTTSKELPGATLSICITYVDENNIIQLEKDQYTEDCIPAILATGKKATWVSTNEPKKIEGLAAGAYYLVENIAPTNYSTAESILFIVSEDGRILDEDGNPITDNKIIMKDKLISNPKTAELPIIIISVIGVLGLATGIIYYYKINKKNNKKISKK